MKVHENLSKDLEFASKLIHTGWLIKKYNYICYDVSNSVLISNDTIMCFLAKKVLVSSSYDERTSNTHSFVSLDNNGTNSKILHLEFP